MVRAMPFTPFHFGPALGIGIPLRNYLHTPTFIVANVILDVEPFLVLLLGLDYPLHGYLHTLVVAFLVGLLLGYVSFKFERFVQPLYRMFLLEPSGGLNIKSFLVAGAFGTMLHVLFDSPLYTDILPFFPLSANPMYNPSSSMSSGIVTLCILMEIFGIAYYAALIIFSAYKKLTKQRG